MSRRKDNAPAISFFSFQDIITSVTGIMFLVVMILILMLLTRRNTSPEQQAKMEELNRLKAECASLEEELSSSVDLSHSIEKQLEPLQKIEINELPTILSRLNTQLAELHQDNEIQEEKRQNATELLKSLQSHNQELNRRLRLGGEQLTANSNKEILLTTQIAKLQENLKMTKKTMKFTWKYSTPKTPVLLECSGNSISIGESQMETPFHTIHNEKTMELIQKTRQWLKTNRPPDSYYLLLLVKPSAFDYARKFSDTLKLDGYERGREILPKDDVVIFQAKEKTK